MVINSIYSVEISKSRVYRTSTRKAPFRPKFRCEKKNYSKGRGSSPVGRCGPRRGANHGRWADRDRTAACGGGQRFGTGSGASREPAPGWSLARGTNQGRDRGSDGRGRAVRRNRVRSGPRASARLEFSARATGSRRREQASGEQAAELP